MSSFGMCSVVSSGACPVGGPCCSGVLRCDSDLGDIPVGVFGPTFASTGVCGADVLSMRSMMGSAMKVTG